MELLSGWKEIAEHLHLAVRTAQRWERLGLPVRRVSDSLCSPVVAIPDELELWARTRDRRTDTGVPVAKRLPPARLAELREIHSRERSKTQTLLDGINTLAKEQERLLGLIRSNLGRIKSDDAMRKEHLPQA